MTFPARTPLHFFSPLFSPLIILIISITLCFGVYNHVISPAPCYLFWFLLMTALLFSKGTEFFRPMLFCLIIAFGGWSRTIFIIEQYHQFPFDTPCASVTGHLIGKSVAEKGHMKYKYTIALTMINEQATPSFTIQLYMPHPFTCEVGDSITLFHIKFPKIQAGDFTKYLLKEGIAATLFATEISYKINQQGAYPVDRWLSRQKNRLLHAFKNNLSHSAFALFSSLFLGEKESSKRAIAKLQKYFKQWGILHYLARSGLHLVIVISVYEFLFRLLPISFACKHFLLLLLNCIYFLFSWPSISFIRAFLIFLWYKLFSLFYFPLHFLHILYLTCILILLFNPLQLFFLDFQLSFGFTFALGWLNQYKVAQKI